MLSEAGASEAGKADRGLYEMLTSLLVNPACLLSVVFLQRAAFEERTQENLLLSYLNQLWESCQAAARIFLCLTRLPMLGQAVREEEEESGRLTERHFGCACPQVR